MIKFQPKTKVIKDRIPAIHRAVARMNNAQVKVGWETNETYPGTETTVAQVAIWNEYGTQGHRVGDKQVGAIPARPFMRQAYAKNLKLILKWQLEARDKVLSGEWSVEKALTAIGYRFQEALRSEIVRGKFQKNRPRTLSQKQSLGQGGRPLIATRRMLNAIRFRVELDGKPSDASNAEAQDTKAQARQSVQDAKKPEMAAQGKLFVAAERNRRALKQAKKAARKRVAKIRADARSAFKKLPETDT